MSATLQAVYIARVKREPVAAMEQAVVVEQFGLKGDRYALRAGTCTKRVEEGDAGRHVTLIEAEAIDAALAEHGVDLSEGRHRRNLVIRGLPLNGLINRQIRIGPDVILRGDRHCHPCRHLSRLTGIDAMASLRMRGGLRTSVVRGGTIRVGDAVHVIGVTR